eukprot:tig00020710_g13370.t1
MAIASLSGRNAVASSRAVELKPYEREEVDLEEEEEQGKGEDEAPDPAAPADPELELNRVVEDELDPSSKRASVFLTWKPPASSATGRGATESSPSDHSPDAPNFEVIQYI